MVASRRRTIGAPPPVRLLPFPVRRRGTEVPLRAFVLAAGRGTRFRPVTDRIPKPLFPFLNVPLARAHLVRLRRFGIGEAAVNLHHLGEKIQQHLIDRPAELPQLRFFPELEILGTAGALRNAADWLSTDDFLVVNCDAAIEPDYESLVEAHRKTGRLATLLVVENREPDRYTPLQSEGDRVTGFLRRASRGTLAQRPNGGTLAQGQSRGTRARGQIGSTLAPEQGRGPLAPGNGDAIPLLYTGVCALSPRLLARIPTGERSLVADLWEPMLEEGHEIGWVPHRGAFADLGQPGDFLRASLEALARRGPFPEGAGGFDEETRTLSALSVSGFQASRCVLGDSAIGRGAHLEASVVWKGASIGDGARLERCLVAGGHVGAGETFRDALLWSPAEGRAAAYSLA